MADRNQSGRGRKKPPKFKAGSQQKHQLSKVKKEENGPLPSTSSTSVPDDDLTSPSPQQQQEDFDRELLWCIQQLEKGLSNPSDKADQRKAQDAAKVLKILQSPKTPLIKKRQVMRITFGDYRKKMEAQLKQASSVYKKMAVKSVSAAGQSKSSFFKRAKLSHTDSHAPVSSVEMDLKNLDIGSGSEKKFTFNFCAPTEVDDKQTLDSKDCDKVVSECEKNSVSNIESNQNNSPQPALNYYKLEPSENTGFKFSFNNSDNT